MKRSLLLALFFILAGAPVLFAAGDADNPVPFLQLPAGAKAIGLGGAFTTLGVDPTAAFYNPAVLARLPYGGVSLTGTTLSMDRYHTALAAAFVSSNTTSGTKRVSGLSGTFVLVDGVEQHADATGTVLGTLVSSSGALQFSRAFETPSKRNWGYAVTGIFDAQDDTRGYGVAVALGMDMLLPMGFRISGVIRDLGFIRYDDTWWLHPRISVALSTILLGADFPLTVQYDYTFDVADSSTLRIGFEWVMFSWKPVDDMTAAYDAYRRSQDGSREPGKDTRRGVELKLRAGIASGLLSGGFSFLVEHFELSYAIAMSEFENGRAAHTLSLNYNF